MIYAYALPLALAISLVYAASRHESWSRILPRAARVFGTIVVILVLSTLALLWINSLT